MGGFTLLEALISLAILAVIASFGFLAYFGYQRSSELNMTTRTVQDYLRQAQNNAMTGTDFKTWGVLFTNPAGSGGDKLEFYSCADASNNPVACSGTGDCGGTLVRTVKETYALPSGVSYTTPGEAATVDICFDKRTGKVQGAEETIVISGTGGSRTVAITAEGRIALGGEAVASSAGPNSPSTVANDAAVGVTVWTSPTNATASDNIYTTVTGGSNSQYLKATGFGFSIPSNATIDGIKVEVEKKKID